MSFVNTFIKIKMYFYYTFIRIKMLSRHIFSKLGICLWAMLLACGTAVGRGAVQPADTAVFPFSFQVMAGGSAPGAPQEADRPDAPQVAGKPDAWAGGLNAAHIAVLDLNGDGQDDLLVFDRNGKIPLCFLYDPVLAASGVSGAAGGPYVYAPACAAFLPPLKEWVQACDYDGDGRPDLFTFNGVAGMSVYRNVSAWETDALGGAVYRLRFELLTARLQAKMYGQYGDLYCIDVDYPALVDVDGDGAVDVLNFWVPSTGDFLHYYRNHALETYGTADSFDLRIEDWSWGCFAENEESNGIYLDSCRPAATATAAKGRTPKHSGSTLGVVPRQTAAGRVYDLLLGDVGYDGLMYLHNGGTPAQARITAYDSLFPAAEPVRLKSMPVVSVLPAGVAVAMGWEAAETHICVSPYNTDVFSTQGRESLWVYALGATSDALAATPAASEASAPPAARQTTGFLQAGMIDHGALSCPTLFDYNGDGLLDVVVGYAGDPGTAQDDAAAAGGLALYENVGTPAQPAFRFVTDDFLGLRRGGLRARALSPAFGDYDGDGTPELVLGTYEGHLLAYTLRYEGGGAAEAVLRDSLFLGLQTSGSTAPALFDVDGDGLLDVVVGCRQQLFTNAAGRRYTRSSLIYYRHTGTVDAATGHPFEKMTDSLGGVDAIDRTFSNYGYARPAFYRAPSAASASSAPSAAQGRAAAPAYLLCGAENGRLKAYAFDGSRWQEPFAAAGDLPWWPADSLTVAAFVGEHSAPAWGDLNGDGRPDLVVGNARGGLHFAWGMAYRPPVPDTAGMTHIAGPYIEPAGVNVYPNPSGGVFHLELPAAATVEVFAANGVLCQRFNAAAGTATLNLNRSGVYLLRIAGHGRTTVKRVVVR